MFGAMIRTVAMDEGGRHQLATALADEGFEDPNTNRLIEGFARHLMRALDTWRERGFDAIAMEYAARLAPASSVCSLAENDDLAAALATPSWLDSATRMPRL